MSPKGGRATRVSGKASGAAWSPDGARLAFTRNGGPGGYGLYTRGVRGGRPQLVAERAAQPAWSSRGDIAFVRYAEGVEGNRMYVIGADGNGERLLVTGEGSELDWSPRGDRLVFIRGGRVHTVGADGRGLRRLTSGPVSANSAAWSPDGKQIAFAKDDLYVMDADGGSVRRVARSKSDAPDRNLFRSLDWQALPPR